LLLDQGDEAVADTETVEAEETSGPRSQMWIHEGMVDWLQEEYEVDFDTLSPAEVIALAFARRNEWRRTETYAALKAGRAEQREAEKAERAAAAEARKAERQAAAAAKAEAAKAEKAAEKPAAKASKTTAKKATASTRKGRTAAKGKASTSEDPFA
jgi:hypothetical protein